MLHDPARSWIWSIEEISGDILERVGVGEFKRVFEILAENMKADGPHQQAPAG
ncbi:MAG: hypothetical protein AAF626_03590 [Pseudomonadota bacterium]